MTTKQNIEKVLWSACDSFRGKIDSSRYKDYILSMLFVKYLSDVYAYTRKKYSEQYGGNEERIARAMSRERFVMDETSTFDYLYNNRNDPAIGEKINVALANIEKNWIGEEYGKYPYTSPEGTQYPNGKLIMSTNAEFPPYELLENGEVVGFDVDMMKAVCDKLGYELEIENIAFDSIIASVNSGKADVGVAGMSVTEDRLKNAETTETYTTSTQVIITRAD